MRSTNALAVAAPDAPLVSRVLAGPFVGSSAGYAATVFVLVTGTVSVFVAQGLAASELKAAVFSAIVVAAIIASIVLDAPRALYARVIGLLPGVVTVHGSPDHATLLDALALLRDLDSPAAAEVFARLAAEHERDPEWWHSSPAGTGVSLIHSLSSRAYVDASADPERTAAIVEVVSLLPLDAEWLPADDVFAELTRRHDPALLAEGLRSGAPVERRSGGHGPRR